MSAEKRIEIAQAEMTFLLVQSWMRAGEPDFRPLALQSDELPFLPRWIN